MERIQNHEQIYTSAKFRQSRSGKLIHSARAPNSKLQFGQGVPGLKVGSQDILAQHIPEEADASNEQENDQGTYHIESNVILNVNSTLDLVPNPRSDTFPPRKEAESHQRIKIRDQDFFVGQGSGHLELEAEERDEQGRTRLPFSKFNSPYLATQPSFRYQTVQPRQPGPKKGERGASLRKSMKQAEREAVEQINQIKEEARRYQERMALRQKEKLAGYFNTYGSPALPLKGKQPKASELPPPSEPFTSAKPSIDVVGGGFTPSQEGVGSNVGASRLTQADQRQE